MEPIVSLEGKTVCVVDAYGLIYQAFHAPGMEMTTERGEPTGALFGFVRDVLNVMSKTPIDYLFCAYDMHAPTFRHDIYPEYKANRSATPDDLLLQFDFTREFLKGLGTPALGVVGYEADDVMATVQRRVAELGGKTILVTSDKDARQLLSDSTSIYLIRKERRYDASDLKADWGVEPSQVVDFQALVGDSSDNVPGAPLVGPKVAGELLQKYGTLEGVFEGAKGQKGKRFENIRNFQDQILMSRKLVALKQDVPLEIDWEAGKVGGIDVERLRRLFQYWRFRAFNKKTMELAERFGTGTAERSAWFDQIEEERGERMGAETEQPTLFSPLGEPSSASDAAAPESPASDASTSLLARLRRRLYGAEGDSRRREDDDITQDSDVSLVKTTLSSLSELPLPSPAPREEWRATLVDDAQKLDALVARLAQAPLVSVAAITLEEPELGRVRARVATLCGLALALEPTEAFYLPFRAPLGAPVLSQEKALAALRDSLESESVAKVGFELKYDALALLTSGIQLRGVAFDTAIADYLALAGETRRTLADVATAYLDVKLFDVKSATGTGQKRLPLDLLAPETVALHALDAVLVPLNSAIVLRSRLHETPALEKLAVELETPLVETLAEMEFQGIAIDTDVFRDVTKRIVAERQALESEIRECVRNADPDPTFADEINLNSPKQLQRLLFDDLKLPILQKTKTGPSVNAEVLEELALMHEIPHKIVELRKLVKLQGTYLEPLPRQRTPGTNRVSATFNQAATATGRLSSSDPNLQNIPARSDSGKLIRSGFVPDASQGYDAFLSCDYSQIELRVLAHFSGDAALRQAFEEDQDVHASVASQIFGVPVDEVTADMRRKAKAVNFGLVYGQTSFGLAKSINVSREAAAAYIDAFFMTYPGVLEFFDRVLDDCARRGYVETLLGRRRTLTGVRGARGRQTLNFPERAAVNTVVQGSAADIMKLAMLAVWRRLKRDGWLSSSWSTSAEKGAIVVAPPPAASVSPALRSMTPLFYPEEYAPEEPSPAATTPTGGASDGRSRDRARLLLQIHDELLFETRREDADELAAIVVKEMTLNNPLAVPLKVDPEIGANWGEL